MATLPKRLSHKARRGAEKQPNDVDDAKDFLFWRAKKIHPALSEPTQFIDWEFKTEERLALVDLEKILSAHDEAATGEKYRECEWATVFDIMLQARSKYEGDRGAARQDAALFGLNLTSELVELFPEDWGLGVMKGGLALLLKVAKGNLEIKAKIVNVFQDLSMKMATINMAFDKLGVEEAESNRQRDFFCTVLRDMPVLIRRLLGKEKWYIKVKNSLQLQLSETDTADAILERWRAELAELGEQMERSKITSMSHIKANTNLLPGLKSSLEASAQSVGQLTDQMTELPQVLQGILQDKLEKFTEALSFKDKAAQAQTLLLEQLLEMSREVEGERQYARELERENEYLREISRENSPQPGWKDASVGPIPAITSMELIGAIGVHVNAHIKDLEDVLHRSSDFDVKSLRQVTGLTKHDEFNHWFKMESCSLLFVECFLQDHGPTISAASVFSSSLICTLSNQRDAIPLFFFARLHCDTPTTNGPVYMMRSLIFQLLMSSALPYLDLGFIPLSLFEACAQQNLSALCELFVGLVCQVPSTRKIYCVLDGLDLYETPEFLWDIQIDYAADMFEVLANRLEEEGGGMLKVLVMIPGRSQRLYKRVWREESPWSCIELMEETF